MGMNTLSEKDEYIVQRLLFLADTFLILEDPLLSPELCLSSKAKKLINLMATVGFYIEERIPFDAYVSSSLLHNELIAEAAARKLKHSRNLITAYALACFIRAVLSSSEEARIYDDEPINPLAQERISCLKRVLLLVEEKKQFSQEILKPFLTDGILLSALLMLRHTPRFSSSIEFTKKILAAYATTTSNTGVLTILIRDGIDLNMRDAVTHNTLLHLSAQSASRKTIELLLNNSVQLEVRNVMGHTPLHEAILSQNYEAVETLLDYGADVNAYTTQNRNAIELAESSNNSRIINLLYARNPLNLSLEITLTTTNNHRTLLGSSNITGFKNIWDCGASDNLPHSFQIYEA